MLALWKGVIWSEAMRIAWLLTWRSFVIFTPLSIVFGVVLAKITEAVGMTLAARIFFIYLVALSYSMCLAWPILLSQLVRKQFKGFRIQIVRGEPDQSN